MYIRIYGCILANQIIHLLSSMPKISAVSTCCAVCDGILTKLTRYLLDQCSRELRMELCSGHLLTLILLVCHV